MLRCSSRTLVAAAVVAALLPAAPALAQTAPPTPSASPSATPRPTATSTPTPSPTTPAPVQPGIAVDRRVVDLGQTHQLVVFGRVGARVQLAAEAASPRAGVGVAFRIIREATLGPDADDPSRGVVAWQLQPGATTRFFALVDGVRSQIVTVQVRRTVTIGIRQTAGTYVFAGTVARPQAGVQVTVARLDAVTKRVTGVASTRTLAGGRYEVRTGLPAGQAGYYVLTSAAPDLLAGRSRLYGLVVPRPATRTVVRPVAAAPRPAPTTRPADVDCSDFTRQADAQAFHDRWFRDHGDFADLDGDGDRRACESLP